MEITLYQGCVVRDTYSRVFSPTTFPAYLATLNQVEFEVESAYSMLSGTLTIDWGVANAQSPYQYNYMKLADDYNGIMFYAFITRVDLANGGLVLLTYNTDIWHTYIGGCRMYDSFVSQSKYIPEGKFHYLPLDYLTNERVEWVSLDDTIGEKYKIMFELQFYTTVESGGIATRLCFVCFSDIEFDSIHEAEQAIIYTGIRQGAGNSLDIILNTNAFKQYPSTEGSPIPFQNLEFEIINTFIVRSSWVERIKVVYPDEIDVLAEQSDALGVFPVQNIEDPTEQAWGYIRPKLYAAAATNFYYVFPDPIYIEMATYDIPADFSIVGVGLATSPVPAQNNGTVNKMTLYMSLDDINVGFYLNVYGQMLDITELLKFQMPYTAINGETAQLRRLADEEKKAKAITKILTSTGKFIGNTMGGVVGASPGTSSATGAKMGGGIISNAAGLASDVANSIIDINIASAGKYQTTYGQQVDSSGAMNAKYGIGYFKLSTIDNEEEVEQAVDMLGYSTNLIPSTDRPFNPFGLSEGYNPTAYDRINLYGAAPQSILNELEALLRKGVKIYYSWEVGNGSID